MDITTHISLCAGYGGIDLGLHGAIPNLRTIAYSEIEAFACANLVEKMDKGRLDSAPIWTDIKTFPFPEFHGLVDILSGGFPCQPFSGAGKRGADSDPRHLFPFILRGIEACQPRVVFLENVEGIISAKIKGTGWRDPEGTPVLLHVLRELERVGYKATAGIFSASEVGAPHQRKRVFIMGYSDSLWQSQCKRDERVLWGRVIDSSESLLAYPHSIQIDKKQQGSQTDEGRGSANLPSGCNPHMPDTMANTEHYGRDGGPVRHSTSPSEEKRRVQQPQGHETGASGLANPNNSGLQRLSGVEPQRSKPRRKHTGQDRQTADMHVPELANTEGNCKPGLDDRPESVESRGESGSSFWSGGAYLFCPDGKYRAVKPGICGVAYGVTDRVDRLRLLGNGCVPQTVTKAFVTLLNTLLTKDPENDATQ